MRLKNMVSTMLAVGLFGTGLYASNAFGELCQFPSAPLWQDQTNAGCALQGHQINGFTVGAGPSVAGQAKVLFVNLSSAQPFPGRSPYATGYGIDPNGQVVNACVASDTTTGGGSVFVPGGNAICAPAVKHRLEVGYALTGPS